MALPYNWRGHPQTHEVPGAFRVMRRVTIAATAGFVAESLRSSAWFGDCPWLANDEGQDVADAVARGILKRVSIRWVPTAENALTTGTRLDYADKNEAAGGDGFNSITAASPTLVRSYPTLAEFHTPYLRAVGGAVVLDVEIYFDVPPAA